MTTVQEAGSRTGSTGTKPFIVSADCHVNEPPDLWEKRIDEQYRHRLPHREMRNGEEWVVVEGHRPVRVRQLKLEGEDLERSKAGSRDPEERRRDLERDGVDAEVIYPNRGLLMYTSPDPGFQAAMCRVWNDWAYEVFQDHWDRMAPTCAVAPIDVPTAVAELERCAKLGFRSVFMPAQVAGKPYNSPEYDPLWAAVQDCGIPISFHVGTGRDPRTASGNGGAIINYAIHALGAAQEPVAQLCSSGVLERFPALRFVTVEAGIGWVPWLLHVLDEAAHKHHFWVRPQLPMLPSEYWRRQGYATFQDDPIGLRLYREVGVDNMLWGNDYPHHEGTWPHSQEVIAATMGHLTDEERAKVLGLNAARLYGFTAPGETAA
jgi:predicted TIM-barrel fold metal-dependent hydrolase